MINRVSASIKFLNDTWFSKTDEAIANFQKILTEVKVMTATGKSPSTLLAQFTAK